MARGSQEPHAQGRPESTSQGESQEGPGRTGDLGDQTWTGRLRENSGDAERGGGSLGRNRKRERAAQPVVAQGPAIRAPRASQQRVAGAAASLSVPGLGRPEIQVQERV